jgi:hypothetical protein
VGEVPVFVLTVQNKGTAAVRVLDAGQKDLQFARYHLKVFEAGKPVDLPSLLPGVPITDDKSYVTVKPGSKVDFQLNKFALRVGKLPPGRYKASVVFTVTSADGKGSTTQETPLAEFNVED